MIRIVRCEDGSHEVWGIGTEGVPAQAELIPPRPARKLLQDKIENLEARVALLEKEIGGQTRRWDDPPVPSRGISTDGEWVSHPVGNWYAGIDNPGTTGAPECDIPTYVPPAPEWMGMPILAE